MRQRISFRLRSGGEMIDKIVTRWRFRRLLAMGRHRTRLNQRHRRPRPGQDDYQQQDQQAAQVMDHGGAAF